MYVLPFYKDSNNEDTLSYELDLGEMSSWCQLQVDIWSLLCEPSFLINPGNYPFSLTITDDDFWKTGEI